MPRPRKCRKVCHFPQTLAFFPMQGEEAEHLLMRDLKMADTGEQRVVLTVDEYEAIRLIDKEGLSQEQCSERMHVARTTVQLIYADARKKLADALVEGLPLWIGGGDYQLCDGRETSCGDGCFKHRFHRQYEKPKGDKTMRVAVTFENGEIFQHFGHTEQFKIYDVEDGKVVSSEVVSTNGSGHGALSGILSALHVDTLICGGIGGGARMALDAAGIQLYGGVTGAADKAVEALLSGELAYDPDAMCSHHDEHHGHHHEGNCGEHGCGEHHCGGHH